MRENLLDAAPHPRGRQAHGAAFEPRVPDGRAVGAGARAAQMAGVAPSHGGEAAAGLAWLLGSHAHGQVVFIAAATCLPHRQGRFCC